MSYYLLIVVVHDESISNLNDIDLEFSEPTYGSEFSELTCNPEFNELTYDSVVSACESSDIDLGSSEEKLYKGLKFRSWDEAYDIIKVYAQQEGDEYKPKNTLVKETNTKYIKCPWHVNLSQPIKNNPNGIIYITMLNNKHNHNLSPYRMKFFNDNAFTQEIHERVEFYLNVVKLKPLQIQKALQKEFPDHEIYLSEIYKVTAKFYCEKRKDISNDAVSLYEDLVKKKNEDPRWYIAIDWDRETHILQRLFWMSPDQIILWMEFGDIVLNDNTTKTNHYDMALSLFLCIDNHGSSRLVGCALIDDKSADSYWWVLRQTKKATGSCVPDVIMTDADPALDLAISEEYEKSYAMHCIFYISQNLPRNLKTWLGQRYHDFIKDFYKARNSLIPKIFEHKWALLSEKYNEPRVAKYLRTLHSSKKAWARAYMAKVFTADVQTTSRVEILDTNISEEIKKAKYIYWKTQIPLTSSVITLPQALFPEVDNALYHFLTPVMLKVQRVEIKSCLKYQASMITKDELIKYQEVCIILFLPEPDDTQFIEDDEDVMQISVNYMLKNVDVNEIEEVWAIRFVNRGIVCQHFFQVMLCSPVAAFHITHVHRRWYKDIHSNLQEKPYIVATWFSKSYSQYPSKLMKYSTNKLFTPLVDLRNERKNDINERKLYGELWGVVRDITQKAVRFHRQDILKKLQDLLTEMQEDVLVSSSTENDNEETCSSSNNNLHNDEDDKENDLTSIFLQNPIKRKAKGRPKSSKRIKRAEELKSTKRQNQCGNCGKYRHYRPKCSKNQENN
ncbi:7746_t:CDS:2 [Cetraspora pellucida]|uniref:7746_t:CDS:1 n=1 Tax=Cetraspora pellucida TaxID=1433469 RepID=A0A9N9BEG5_9GLOM|nr:7746_t:CDS:2 [Cetraspora pellucida]